jgi:hypothetical protein
MEIYLFMSKGSVTINFTIGFGNNLFQYCMGKLISQIHDLPLNHRAIPEVEIWETRCVIEQSLPVYVVDDSNYKEALYMKDLSNYNVVINGYFEDYKIIKKYLSEARSWFNKVEITNKKDVILHLRLQNRLIQVSHNKNHITADSFKNIIKEFDYDRLHIVTDAEKWTEYNLEDIEKIRQEIRIGPNPPSNSPWVEPEQSLEYMNHLIDGLSELNPIVHCNGENVMSGTGGLRGGFIDDFNLLRSFNQVIIHNSTFSWWAATLSGAENVAIFNPWKIAKPKHQRRNLGSTKYPGWFSWGSADDLYFKKYGIK